MTRLPKGAKVLRRGQAALVKAEARRALDDRIVFDDQMIDWFEFNVIDSISSYARTSAAKIEMQEAIDLALGTRGISFEQLKKYAENVASDLKETLGPEGPYLKNQIEFLQRDFDFLSGKVHTREYDMNLLEGAVDIAGNLATAVFGSGFGAAAAMVEIPWYVFRRTFGERAFAKGMQEAPCT